MTLTFEYGGETIVVATEIRGEVVVEKPHIAGDKHHDAAVPTDPVKKCIKRPYRRTYRIRMNNIRVTLVFKFNVQAISPKSCSEILTCPV
jgi:hypothetical protein